VDHQDIGLDLGALTTEERSKYFRHMIAPALPFLGLSSMMRLRSEGMTKENYIYIYMFEFRLLLLNAGTKEV